MVNKEKYRPMALILGGSSGLGFATAKKLAQEGFDLVLVHRDRKSEAKALAKKFETLVAQGANVKNFNADAVSNTKQPDLWKAILTFLGNRKIKVLVHSIAKGNLKPMVGTNALNSQDFQLTIQSMAISLYDWVKLIHHDDRFDDGARVIAFTSEGSSKAIANYGAVSAAKAALEAIVRQIALEFAKEGILANCILAGVTDTKSLRMIPNAEELKKHAIFRNPNHRLTTPDDVANAVYLLTRPEANWITGTVIRVDGGESLQ